MTKHEIKGDDPKTNATLREGVRPPHISAEAPVMGVERRGRQSPTPAQKSNPANTSGGIGETRGWKGQTYLNRWERISSRAQRESDSVFNNLFLHINEESLQEAYDSLEGSKAVGVDSVSKSEYGKNLQENIRNLLERLKKGTCRPLPKREIMIPKADGGERPIEIACFEDKMVEWVVARILTSIYDIDFVPESYGFRPRRSAHQAVEAVHKELERNRRPHVVEIDFSNFFCTIPHGGLWDILSERIADANLLRLIKMFLEGKTVKRDGTVEKCSRGTPQGGIMSPILANIYLDRVLDKWFKENYRGGKMVRYADNAVFLFRKEDEAKEFLEDFKTRVENHGLSVNEEKSRTLSLRKSEHNQFDFLGFTYYWGKQGKRRILKVKTRKKSHHAAMKSFYDWIKLNRNRMRLSELWKLARSKIRGYHEYFGYWMNRRKLIHFHIEVRKTLYKWLNRRSQKRSYTWEGFNERVKNFPLGYPPKLEELKRIGWSFGNVYN